MKHNIALIGYGYWGKKIYGYLKNSDEFNLCYVFAPSFKTYAKKRLSQELGKEFIGDINHIWNDAKVDNVIIATPIDTHFDVACEALTHSKNILIEKPLAMTMNEAERLAKLARAKGRIIETEFTYTYSKALAKAKDLVLQGVIGQVRSLEISFKQLGRFLPYDVYLLLASHALSILDMFFSIEKCLFSASALMEVNKVVTSALITFRSRDKNCRGFIDISLHCPQRVKKTTIFGENGTITYAPDAEAALSVTLYKKDNALLAKDLIQDNRSFKFDESNNLKNALENFHNVLSGKEPCNIARSLSVNKVLKSVRTYQKRRENG